MDGPKSSKCFGNFGKFPMKQMGEENGCRQPTNRYNIRDIIKGGNFHSKPDADGRYQREDGRRRKLKRIRANKSAAIDGGMGREGSYCKGGGTSHYSGVRNLFGKLHPAWPLPGLRMGGSGNETVELTRVIPYFSNYLQMTWVSSAISGPDAPTLSSNIGTLREVFQRDNKLQNIITYSCLHTWTDAIAILNR